MPLFLLINGQHNLHVVSFLVFVVQSNSNMVLTFLVRCYSSCSSGIVLIPILFLLWLYVSQFSFKPVWSKHCAFTAVLLEIRQKFVHKKQFKWKAWNIFLLERSREISGKRHQGYYGRIARIQCTRWGDLGQREEASDRARAWGERGSSKKKETKQRYVYLDMKSLSIDW